MKCGLLEMQLLNSMNLTAFKPPPPPPLSLSLPLFLLSEIPQVIRYKGHLGKKEGGNLGMIFSFGLY